MEDRLEILEAVKTISRITGIEIWKLLDLIDEEMETIKYNSIRL
ncbi:MAG: hypothetical protein ACOCP8_07595 [archaeon]